MEKRKYEQLCLRERIEIYRLHADGKSLRCIAGVLGRSAATISRELKRNSKVSKKWAGGYDPERAQQLMLRRHARGRAHKLERQPELREKVLQHLVAGWSPEQIAGRMAQGPGSDRISYESIYRYIYWRSGSFNETLHRWLPRQKYRRGKRLPNGRWSTASILERVSIHDRPAVVESRTRSGDWEADLMSFRKPGQFLLVMQERRSRRALLVRQKVRTAQSVADNLRALVEAMPARVCQSMTFDNGAEFSKHYLLSRGLASRPGSATRTRRGRRAASKTRLVVCAACCPETPTSTPCPPIASPSACNATTTRPENASVSKLPTRYSWNTLLHFKREFIPSLRSG